MNRVVWLRAHSNFGESIPCGLEITLFFEPLRYKQKQPPICFIHASLGRVYFMKTNIIW